MGLEDTRITSCLDQGALRDWTHSEAHSEARLPIGFSHGLTSILHGSMINLFSLSGYCLIKDITADDHVVLIVYYLSISCYKLNIPLIYVIYVKRGGCRVEWRCCQR